MFFLQGDLTDDGCLGKVNFVFQHPPPQSQAAATHHAHQDNLETCSFDNFVNHWGKPYSQVGLLPAAFWRIPNPSQHQPLTLRNPHNRKITSYLHLSSAGGLPL
jgi:hypothetical protein